MPQNMEANKIKGKAQGLTLDNGAELTYCELGEDNPEILVIKVLRANNIFCKKC